MTLEETIAHHRWCADNCEGKVRDEHLQMVAWLEELVELRAWNSEFGCSMNDYNRGALKEPCLRLPYGFGEEVASVELGDGTGYVRLTNYEKVAAENEKLRKLAEGMYGILATFDAILGSHDACETPRPLIFGEDKSFKDVMCELGIEVGSWADASTARWASQSCNSARTPRSASRAATLRASGSWWSHTAPARARQSTAAPCAASSTDRSDQLEAGGVTRDGLPAARGTNQALPVVRRGALMDEESPCETCDRKEWCDGGEEPSWCEDCDPMDV